MSFRTYVTSTKPEIFSGLAACADWQQVNLHDGTPEGAS